MNEREDELLMQLGALAREQDRTPMATQEPLSEAYKNELFERALQAAARRSRDRANATAGTAEEAHTDGAAGEARTSRAPRSNLRHLAWLAPVAAAAAVLLWLRDASPGVEAMPAYSLEVSGGQAELRAVAQGDVRVGDETRLQLVLRPQRAVPGEVGVAVFFMGPKGPLRWPAEVEAADTGALRVRLAPPPAPVGEHARARVVVGRPVVLDAHATELVLDERGERGRGFQRFDVALAPVGKREP